jgi:KS-AT-KR-ACP domain-containing polyene macrolide polyketide synthase/pimaricinolide synthase PimS2
MADNADAEIHARRAGIGALDPELACTVLRQLVVEDEATAVVVAVERGRQARGFRPNALMRDMPGFAELPDGPRDTAVDGALRDRLLPLPKAARLEAVLDLIRARAADVLGRTDTDAVSAERPFRDLGFDSLATVELRNQLNVVTGLSLASTLVFDHPTPLALAEHVLEELLPDGETGSGAEEAGIRELLAAVPLERLREIGVLEPLLKLAGRSSSESQEEETESIDSMSVDDLVRAALDGPSTPLV